MQPRWPSDRIRAAFVLVSAIAGAAIFLAVVGRSYPIRDWLFWKLLGLAALAAYFALACVSAGLAVLTRLFRVTGLPALETLVHAAAIGLIVFILGMYVAGFAHAFGAPFAILWPTALIASGARPLVAFARERLATSPDRAPSAFSRTIAAFGVLGLVLVYLGALTPEAINFDASWSHIPIAVDYARAGRIVRFDADYTRNFPHLASLLHTWAMILPAWGVLTEPPLRWMLALHLEMAAFAGTLAGVAAMTAWLLDRDRAPGAWAAFFLFPGIFVYDMNLGGAADHVLAFFAPPLFLAAVRAAPHFDRPWCALAGAYAGAALSTKYQAVYLLSGVALVFSGLWLASMSRRAQPDAPSWRALLFGPLALATAFALVTAPHFVKNWAFYGNPLYPFAQDIFASRPTVPHAAFLYEYLFKDYYHRPHGTLLANIVDAARLVFSFSFVPHYSFQRGFPSVGSLFTLGLPITLALRSSARIWLGYAAGIGAVFAWAMIFRVDRHLQTFLPLCVATTAAVLARAWELGFAARAGVTLLVGVQVIWGGDAPFYAGGHRRLVASLDLLSSGFDGKAATRFAGFRATERAIGAALPANARVLLHMHRTNLGIDHDTMLDWAGQQGLIHYEDLHGPRDVFELHRSLGVTHLVRIPGQRPSSTKQQDVLFTDFVHRFAPDRRTFDDRELIAMPAAPPPPERPYRVLAVGLSGYRDGLYPIESMKVYEELPERDDFPPPPRPLPPDPAAQTALAAEASAACIGARAAVSPELARALDERFEIAEAYKSKFRILVRKGQSP